MSALNFMLNERFCLVAMDSLALRPDGRLFKFVTKFLPLVHVRTVVACTGVHNVAFNWYITALANVLADDITTLDHAAPDYLRASAREVGLHDSKASTTVYQFGYSEFEKTFLGFAYRSTNDFESERLEYGVGVKPPEGLGDTVELEFAAVQRGEKDAGDAFVAIIEKQKLVDDSKPQGERIGIGGEVHYFQMNEKVMSIDVRHRFADYSAAYHQMLRNLKEDGGTMF